MILVVSLVPVVALFGLLGWALVQSSGNPGGFGINSTFGEVNVAKRPARDFIEQALDGGAVSISGLKGKVVMVDFWASWCPPCRREAPGLAQVYDEYKEENVEFIGIAIWDEPERAARHVSEFGLAFPNVLDENGKIAIDYGVAGIPEKTFIDADGNIVRKFVGPIEPDTLRDVLNGLLGKQ